MGFFIRTCGSQRKEQNIILPYVLAPAPGFCHHRILLSLDPNLPTNSIFEHKPFLLNAHRVLDTIQFKIAEQSFDHE